MAASICAALIKSIIEEEESVWLPHHLQSLEPDALPPPNYQNIDFISAAQIEAAVIKLWPECPDSFSPSETEGYKCLACETKFI